MLAIALRFDDVHRIGVSEIVNVEEVVSLSHEVERIIAVSLQPLSSIDNLSSVSIEYCPFAVLLSEAF